MKTMTDMTRSSISPFYFLIQILTVSAGLAVMSYLLASGFNLRLGLVLFFMGILSMGLGNMLSLPARRYERLHGIRHINLFKLPAPEEYLVGNLFIARQAASFYCFENALLFAGFIILIVGLLILF
jgi:hypothetical protein